MGTFYVEKHVNTGSMGWVGFFFSHRDRVIEIYEGVFNPVEEDEDDIRNNEQDAKEEEQTLKERKMLGWVKMIYYLSVGDITKTEEVLKQNANWVFMHLSFEMSNKKWVKNLKGN